MSASMPPAKRQRADYGPDASGVDASSQQHQYTSPYSLPQPYPYSYPYGYSHPHPQIHHMQMPVQQIQMQVQPIQQIPTPYMIQQPLGTAISQSGPTLPPISHGGLEPKLLQSIRSFTSNTKQDMESTTLDLFEEQVADIPAAMLRRIVIETAAADPKGALAMALWQAQKEILDRERTRVLNFDGYSKEAWHELNTKYDHLHGSKEYDAAFDAQDAIEGMLDDIVAKTHETSSYGTKKSAVETMRKIFKSLLLSVGQIPRQVRNSCYKWDDNSYQVVEVFGYGELERLTTEDGGQWLEKIRELVGLAKDYCILEKLKDALLLIEAGGEVETDGEGNEEDYYEEEGTEHQEVNGHNEKAGEDQEPGADHSVQDERAIIDLT